MLLTHLVSLFVIENEPHNHRVSGLIREILVNQTICIPGLETVNPFVVDEQMVSSGQALREECALELHKMTLGEEIDCSALNMHDTDDHEPMALCAALVYRMVSEQVQDQFSQAGW